MSEDFPKIEYNRKGYRGFHKIAHKCLNKSVQERVLKGEKFKVWNGAEQTVPEQLKWMYEHARKYLNTDEGFKSYGTYKGTKMWNHPELTTEADGYGYFKLNAKLSNISPDLFLSLMQDNKIIGQVDATVVTMIDMAIVPQEITKSVCNGRAKFCYWCNRVPGLSVKHRDGVDLTSWHIDDDGTYWFTSHSTPFDDVAKGHPGAIRGVDTYFAYKIVHENNEDGIEQIDVTLVSQTKVGGWLPKFLINRVVGRVLADYVTTGKYSNAIQYTSAKLNRLLIADCNKFMIDSCRPFAENGKRRQSC
uniref:START domain-containing protein n=1 Tax=Aplanochytrium stocchinoi TaxID=215587 RepID=A0A7S3LQF7_9STRA